MIFWFYIFYRIFRYFATEIYRSGKEVLEAQGGKRKVYGSGLCPFLFGRRPPLLSSSPSALRWWCPTREALPRPVWTVLGALSIALRPWDAPPVPLYSAWQADGTGFWQSASSCRSRQIKYMAPPPHSRCLCGEPRTERYAWRHRLFDVYLGNKAYARSHYVQIFTAPCTYFDIYFDSP